jgi:hypothetical protein
MLRLDSGLGAVSKKRFEALVSEAFDHASS